MREEILRDRKYTNVAKQDYLFHNGNIDAPMGKVIFQMRVFNHIIFIIAENISFSILSNGAQLNSQWISCRHKFCNVTNFIK